MPRQTSQKRELLASTLNKVLLGVFAVVLGFVLFTAVRPQTAHAVTDSTLNFQARLQTAAGAIVPDGYYNIEFKLYTASSGGTAVWTEDQTYQGSSNDYRVRVANGYVSVYLGSVTSFPSTINWDSPLWLTMNVGGATTTPSYDGEMNPRLQLTSVPYAFRAGQLATSNSGNTLTSTLSIQSPTGGAQSFVLQDQGAAGTYNILTAPSGSDGYVKLQSGSPGTAQSGNINVNGAIIGSSLQASSAGITDYGALSFSGTTTTNYTTPLGATLATKINIPNYAVGAYNQVLALGLPSTADYRARAITIADARTGGHQPTIAILSPDENQIFGLSFDGSNTTAVVKTSTNYLGFSVNGGTAVTIDGSTAGQVGLSIGSGSSSTGGINFFNSTNSNIANLQSAVTSTSYVTQLPTAIGSAGQCLSVVSAASGVQALGYTACGGSSGISSIGALDGGTANANGATISSSTLYLQSASASFAGLVNTGAQTFAGAKTFNGNIKLAGSSIGSVLYNETLSLGSGGLYVQGGDGIELADSTYIHNSSSTGNALRIGGTPSVSATSSVIQIGNAIQGGNVVTNGGTYIGLNAPSSGAGSAADLINLEAGNTTKFKVDITGGVTALGQTVLGGGANQTQVVIKANASQSATTPLILFKNSGGSEIGRFNIDNYSDLFIGNAAGSSVSGGTLYNTLIGSSAGASTTTGKNNTALGYQSLLTNTINDNNTAIGSGALQRADAGNNTAVGDAAGSYISTGYNNSLLGSGAGIALTNGHDNTAIGTSALSSVIGGYYDSALGAQAGGVDLFGNFATVSTVQNSTAIGAYAQVQQSNSIVLGSVDLATSVGIGTTKPQNTFSVSPLYYSAGTASQSGTTVTGSSTTWTSAMVGMTFIFADGDSGTITAVASGTSLTLSVSQTESNQAYRIHTVGFQVTSSGTSFIQDTSTNAFGILNNSGTSLLNADTTNSLVTVTNLTNNGNLSVGSSPGNGALLNYGSTVNATDAIGDLPTGGAFISSSFIEYYTSFSINQTTPSKTITVPTPTHSTVYGRVIYVSNVGTASFTILGAILNPGATATLIWSNTNGSASWSFAGADKSSIVNQTTQQTGANFNIDGTGTIGTSLTTPLVQSTSSLALQASTGNISLVTNSASASIIAKTGTNSTTGFQIQNSTSVPLFNLDTTTGNITLGTGGNTVVFTASGGLTASGTAQHTKTINLTAEYAGAVLDATNDSTCSSANNGTMTSGYDFTNRVNYYKWTTSQTTKQCYDVVVQVPIPSDFAGWATVVPVNLSVYSSTTAANTINLEFRDSSGTVDPTINFTDATPGTASTWGSYSPAAPTGTYTAGTTMTIRLRMSGISSSDVRIGNITLNYKSSF